MCRILFIWFKSSKFAFISATQRMNSLLDLWQQPHFFTALWANVCVWPHFLWTFFRWNRSKENLIQWTWPIERKCSTQFTRYTHASLHALFRLRLIFRSFHLFWNQRKILFPLKTVHRNDDWNKIDLDVNNSYCLLLFLKQYKCKRTKRKCLVEIMKRQTIDERKKKKSYNNKCWMR